ncbi:hypothetical protein KVH22_25230 [Streptomyces olivaceus]|uniref:hypothetical protein n=1 Tax=Streptomyces olivaceus TaxID=47716 RepID=UPI0021E179CC|nr:hypothetical protein [Streptomyces olivaceus]MBZ6258821.1 hypothetical protein [Streptomyces olivaceus]
MTRQTGPACGNNPNHPMSNGDRRVVDDFQAYLAQRATIRDRVADTLRPWLPGADEADVAHVTTAVLNSALREAAASIDATFTGPGVDRHARHAATLLRRIADEAAAETEPDFFQPGRTYTSGTASTLPPTPQWTFQVTTVAKSPRGDRVALGFLTGATYGCGVWTPHGEDDVAGWTAVVSQQDGVQ